MPVKKCQYLGEKGWKYGNSGKCYSSKEKAKKQGAVIKTNEKKQGGYNGNR